MYSFNVKNIFLGTALTVVSAIMILVLIDIIIDKAHKKPENNKEE